MGRDYEIRNHIWENFVLQGDRPDPDTIVDAILSDDPTLIEHDRNDVRGSACDVEAYTRVAGACSSGFICHRPIRLTAYYFDAPPARNEI
jgi:hypothetical protein